MCRTASDAFLDAVEQAVRLIRSKGVGVFFVTQRPTDVPDSVLAQLGNRVQHALRAHTPNDAKALRATVSTYPTSGYDLEQVLGSLRTGEAVVTVLSEKGAPTPVARTMLRAPQGQIGPSAPSVLAGLVAESPLAARYAEVPAEPRRTATREDENLVQQVVGSSAFRSMLRSAGTVVGREITRSILGTGRRRRRR